MNSQQKQILSDLIDEIVTEENPLVLDDDLSDVLQDQDERDNAVEIIYEEMKEL
jgi:hypothetical protein